MSSEVIQALSLMPPTRAKLEMSPPGVPAAGEARSGVVAQGLARFNDFYTRHAQFVARSLRRLGIHDELLDDALQEVFVIVHRKLPELSGAEHEKTWVFRTCDARTSAGSPSWAAGPRRCPTTYRAATTSCSACCTTKS